MEHGRVRRIQPVYITGAGVVELAACQLGVAPSPHLYSGSIHLEAREATARIRIGPGTCINNNFTAIAERTTIDIGANVLVGVNVSIYDSDFHALSPTQRTAGKQAVGDVRIGCNVFLGSNVTVLKGVSIGEDSVVANGSVVTRDIPPGVCAGGVPCRVLAPLPTPQQ